MARSVTRSSQSLFPMFPLDPRDRSPGTHFSEDLGRTPRRQRRRRGDDPHVDEDLGCSEYGIDIGPLGRGLPRE